MYVYTHAHTRTHTHTHTHTHKHKHTHTRIYIHTLFPICVCVYGPPMCIWWAGGQEVGSWLEDAGEQQRKALEMGRRTGKESIICAATGNLGKVYMEQGRVDEATAMFETAHALSQPGSRSRVAQGINVSQVLANPEL